MLKHAPIAIAALLIAYVILYLRAKLHRKRPSTEPTEPAVKPEAPRDEPVSLPTFPFETIRDVPIPGSELRYWHPFGPADTIADIWCKLQTLSSTEQIVVRLGSPEAPPLFKSKFNPDGVVHSTGAMFDADFAAGLLRAGWPSVSRQVRALSSFGVPAAAPEGAYHIYTGPLLIELREVQLSNIAFRVRATFDPNLRLVLRHLSTGSDYLQCPAASGDNGGGMVVGFPWTLTRLTLYSDDRHLLSGVPEFVKALKTKYEKYVHSDPSFKGDLISDGVVAISVAEGVAKRSNNKTLQITYLPVPNGPLDDLASADEEFIAFAKTIIDRGQCLPAQGQVSIAEAAKQACPDLG